MGQPNILLITSDQHRADCFGFENPHIRAPHLDRLAAAGTRFSTCITPNLVCQPSRASILTGLLPLTHGVWDNGVDLDPRIGEQGFAGTLAVNGYDTALFGKAHFSTKATFQPTGTPECMRSGARHGANWRGPYMGFVRVELAVLAPSNGLENATRRGHSAPGFRSPIRISRSIVRCHGVDCTSHGTCGCRVIVAPT